MFPLVPCGVLFILTTQQGGFNQSFPGAHDHFAYP